MRKIVPAALALYLAIAPHTCKQIRTGSGVMNERAPSEPLIQITPLQSAREQWKIAATNEIRVTITAPGAETVQIFARPVGIGENHLELQTLATSGESAKGEFSARVILPPDFAGFLWAEANFSDSLKKRTEPVALSAYDGNTRDSPQLAIAGGSIGTDESARSDKLTGGKIRRAKFIPGEPDIRITINAPAYLLTLWQNGSEISAYPIGIGKKNFPIPVGERQAVAIIHNPLWIPTEGVWKFRGQDAQTPERDGKNSQLPALSKIKIPLGGGYMIREATVADHIGHASSSGSIVMRGPDLVDLVTKILSSRGSSSMKLGIPLSGIPNERLAMMLSPPVLVDINYDLQVVEGGTLHIYPDVYERGAFAIDSLRAELQSAGVAAALLDDKTLRLMLDQVSVETQFVINVADIRKGRWKAGRSLPLVPNQLESRRDIALARGGAGWISR